MVKKSTKRPSRKDYLRKWRKDHPENYQRHLAQNNEYKKNNRRNWLKWIENFFGKIACFRCGYSHSYYGLDFHHLDKKDKDFKISEMLRGPQTAKKKREIKKCIILCANCHAKEHADQNGETVHRVRRRTWIPIFEEIYEVLACRDCGLTDFDLLVFHHLDPSTKLFKLSKYVGPYDATTASEEIITLVKIEAAKCIPLCRNHHQEFHETQNDEQNNLVNGGIGSGKDDSGKEISTRA